MFPLINISLQYPYKLMILWPLMKIKKPSCKFHYSWKQHHGAGKNQFGGSSMTLHYAASCMILAWEEKTTNQFLVSTASKNLLLGRKKENNQPDHGSPLQKTQSTWWWHDMALCNVVSTCFKVQNRCWDILCDTRQKIRKPSCNLHIMVGSIPAKPTWWQ